MQIGDIIKYRCGPDGKNCLQCVFCAPKLDPSCPSEESTRIGLVLGPARDGAFDCQFDFGIWDVWPEEVEVISGIQL